MNIMNKLYNGFWFPGTTGFSGCSHISDKYTIEESKTFFSIPHWFPVFRYASFGLQHHVPRVEKYKKAACDEILKHFKISIKLYDVDGEDPHKYVWRGWAESAADMNTSRTVKGVKVYSHMSVYTMDGQYVGSPATAWMLLNRGIEKPEYSKEGNSVCSVGKSTIDGRWYGWSHRAIYGFGIGDTVTKGHCAYRPSNLADFLDDCNQFWTDEDRLDISTKVVSVENEDGVSTLMAETSWTYGGNIPNEKLRNTISGVTNYIPDDYGRGEWTAENDAEVRQMAVDFSSGVS